MDLLPLIYSLIGGVTVAAVNHFLTRRHQLLMKRELYREILYREKVAAYREVYALGFRFINKTEKLDLTGKSALGYGDAFRAQAAFFEAVNERGLFMPEKVVSTLGTFEIITEDMIETPSLAKERYELAVEPSKDQVCLLAGKEESVAILDILKEDLGVEILTADLGEFFRTAALQPEKKPFWKSVFQKNRASDKSDAEND